jgi:hypothetical protein
MVECLVGQRQFNQTAESKKSGNEPENGMKLLNKLGLLAVLVTIVVMSQVPKVAASFIINANPTVKYTPDPASDALAIPVLDSQNKPFSKNPTTEQIEAAIPNGGGLLGELLYKVEDDGDESGSLKKSYALSSPVFAPLSSWGALDTFPIKIIYDGGDFANPSYLLVKDGNCGSFIFSLSDWDGKEEIDIYNVFYPKKKDMSGTSHIEFFGTVTAVPEPSTVLAGALLLLPFGISTIRTLRQKRAA